VWGVVYSRFSPQDVELTIATDRTCRWASQRALRAILAQPFITWGKRRCTFVVAADNARSLDLCRRLGAVDEGVVRKAFPNDVDAIVLGMLREEAARWIKPVRKRTWSPPGCPMKSVRHWRRTPIATP
jgi:hypothetical protein